jgi:hypothetical protein
MFITIYIKLKWIKIIPAILFVFTIILITQIFSMTSNSSYSLLTDPFLQFPTETSIKVVWFTEFPGTEHKIIYGKNLEKIVIANTTKLSRTREDEASKINTNYEQTTRREIWKHEGEVTGLKQGDRIDYKVISIISENGNKNIIKSKIFSLNSSPKAGTNLKYY